MGDIQYCTAVGKRIIQLSSRIVQNKKYFLKSQRISHICLISTMKHANCCDNNGGTIDGMTHVTGENIVNFYQFYTNMLC